MTSDPPHASTLEEVALRAGVSRSTVSRVLNGIAVDPVMRRKVDQAVRETGYVPNYAARSLVTRRTNSVALVIAEPTSGSSGAAFLERIFSDPYFGRVTAGAQGVLRGSGIHLVVLPADRDDHDFVLAYLRQGHVDGVLVISSADDTDLPLALHQLHVPSVLSHQPAPGVPLSWVDADQAAGGRLAAEHLAARGVQSCVAVAGPEDLAAARERLDGFLAAATAAGMAVEVLPGDFTARSGVAAARTIVDKLPETDGVFAANDLMAESVVRHLQDAGRRVPQDVVVVGFDDTSTALDTSPPLTTVRQPVEDMAAEMARLLLDRIASPQQPPRGVLFQPSLVVRGTA